MARQFRMTWNRKQKRWSKKHGGKQYFVGCKVLQTTFPALYQGDTEEGSYQAANSWWQTKVVELDTAAQAEADREYFKPLGPGEYLGYNPPVVQASILSGPTLETVKSEWLAVKHATVGNGLSAGRYANVARAIGKFVAHVGSIPVASLNAGVMTAYHTSLLQKVQDGKMKPGYAAMMLKVAKAFLQWCWENEKISALPRNLRSLTITVPTDKITTYTVDTIKALLHTTMSDKTRLYMLLMLNTGMTQKDISDLRDDEVDWKAGTITRKRSKTQNHDSVPEVTYPLWPETFKLLQQFRSTGPRVLTSKNGLPLVTSKLVAGRLKQKDVIRSAWDEVDSKVKLPLKYFRKTSSSILGGVADYATIADLFLGHSPKTMAEKRYKKPPLELLADGVKHLGEVYGVQVK
jgi:integrase